MSKRWTTDFKKKMAAIQPSHSAVISWISFHSISHTYKQCLMFSSLTGNKNRCTSDLNIALADNSLKELLLIGSCKERER